MDQNNADLMSAASIVTGAIAIAVGVASIWAMVRIVQKAGYSGWNILWYFVPIVGIVMFFVFAFSEWPINRRIREMELQAFGPSSSGAGNRPA
jgi:hypothetical protein